MSLSSNFRPDPGVADGGRQNIFYIPYKSASIYIRSIARTKEALKNFDHFITFFIYFPQNNPGLLLRKLLWRILFSVPWNSKFHTLPNCYQQNDLVLRLSQPHVIQVYLGDDDITMDLGFMHLVALVSWSCARSWSSSTGSVCLHSRGH